MVPGLGVEPTQARGPRDFKFCQHPGLPVTIEHNWPLTRGIGSQRPWWSCPFVTVVGRWFDHRTITRAGLEPISVTAGDLNRDGLQDMVVANGLSNEVSVLLGHGDGTFEPPLPFAIGSQPSSIVLGDFNEDQQLDVLVASEFSYYLSLLPGK